MGISMSKPNEQSRERAARAEVYDSLTLFFHWLTVLFVIALFGTSLVWNYIAPRDRFWRSLMESTHVSLGILFALLILVRIVWRLTSSRRLAPEPGISGVLSRIMYGALYLLLAIEAVLGFVLRWVQGEEFALFGLFTIPALIGENRGIARSVESFHNWAAWAIVILALGHAAVALFHHYVLTDAVMERMSFSKRPAARSLP